MSKSANSQAAPSGSKPQTIAVVSDAVFPFNKGGKEMRIFQLTRQLAANGYDVHVYTMKWWDTPGDYQADGVTYHAISKLYPLYDGERRSIKSSILFCLACFKLLRCKFDLLDVDHMPFFPLYTCKIVALVKRKPLFATWHEVWGKAYWQEYLPGYKGLIAWWIEKFSIYTPNHITAVSGHTMDRLRNDLHYKGPISLVTNGIDYRHIAAIKPARDKSDIIFTGRLLKHKNVDKLIKAVGLLTGDLPNIRCLIIGGGPKLERLRQLVKNQKLSKNITVTGFVESSDDVFAHMKSSTVFVLPSTREGFGITVLEAYACNLSIVTANHRDNAAQYIAPADASVICDVTPKALAAAIRQQLQRKPQTHRDAAVYDWGALTAKLQEVYAS